MIDAMLQKAQRALQTARLNLDDGDSDAAVSRSYYAVFYATWAMFAAAGANRPKTHSGTIAEFGRRFVKDGPLDNATGAILSRLENLRNYADYTLEDITSEKAEIALREAETFVKVIQNHLQNQDES
jgi:uncharacterized protein (UPF0332 family)